MYLGVLFVCFFVEDARAMLPPQSRLLVEADATRLFINSTKQENARCRAWLHAAV